VLVERISSALSTSTPVVAEEYAPCCPTMGLTQLLIEAAIVLLCLPAVQAV
jgi:hypothetical protein